MALTYIRPDADSIDGTWTNEAGSQTNLYASIDETSANDSDFIRSANLNLPNHDICKVRLSDPAFAAKQPATVHYRFRKQGEAATQINLDVSLLQGSTLIAKWSEIDIGTSFVNGSQTLTTPQFNSITDFTDLYLQFDSFVPIMGTLWAWGYNRHGEMGIGVASNSSAGPYYAFSSPIQVGTLATWTYVRNGWLQAFGRTIDGKVFAWGANFSGELGLGDHGVDRSSPVQLGALTSWTSISSGSNSWSGGIIGGKAYTWGNGNNGWGATPASYVSSSPVQIGARTDWSSLVVQTHFAHGIIGGKLYAWGENDWAALGTGYYTVPGLGASSPIQIGSRTDWLEVIRGFNVTTFVLDTQNKLWACGHNGNGELGNLQHPQREPNLQATLGNHTWSKIASGKYHCLGIDTAGYLWVWGGNFYGQLGLSYTMGDLSGYRSSPIQLGTEKWISVAAGQHQSHGVKANGTLWSWGKSAYGRLGTNQPYGPQNSPIQVGTLNKWLFVSCGQYTGFAIQKV